MFRLVIALGAGLLMAFQSASPQLAAQLAELAEDAGAARSFDYMALKATGLDLKAQSDAVYSRLRAPDGSARCMTDAEAVLHAGLGAAYAAPDVAAFERDRRAVEEAWTRWIAFDAAVMGGAPVAEPPFSHVAETVAEAGAASHPRVRELLRRAAREQLIRRGWGVGAEVWGHELPSPGTRARFESRLVNQMCDIDSGNTAWLKADLAANGWYRISTHGEAASGAAWLMTQHADRDPAFQREVLTILEPLVAEKETSAANFAYLYDRIAMNAGRPQRFGTQGLCSARNVWAPIPLEDPDRVEALREEAGIGSLAEYTAHMHRLCANFDG